MWLIPCMRDGSNGGQQEEVSTVGLNEGRCSELRVTGAVKG